jgi:alkyl hydroperoxide reductase subunit AhpC
MTGITGKGVEHPPLHSMLWNVKHIEQVRQRTMRSLEAGIFTLLIIAALFFQAPGEGVCDIQRGSSLPDMKLRDEKGEMVPLFSRDEKKVLLIWLTDSCDSCMAGFAGLSSFAGEYSPKGVKVVIININLDESHLKARMTAPADPSMLILRDESWAIPRTFDENWIKGVCPLKNLIIIDREGIVQFVRHYPGIPPEVLREELKMILQR